MLVSLIVMVPVIVVTTTGAKLAVIVHVCPGVRVTPVQLSLSENPPSPTTRAHGIYEVEPARGVNEVVVFLPAHLSPEFPVVD